MSGINRWAIYSSIFPQIFYCFSKDPGPLKVVGNEKNWGSGRSQMLGYGVGPWRSMFIYNLNMQF